jgi:alkylation response protein AidB-like acyl-CoA dehydrogenase
MELALDAEDRAFRDEVRGFVRDALRAETRRKVEMGLQLAKDDFVAWQDALAGRGWLVPNWPIEHGGTDWTPLQRHIFEDELARGSTPRVVPFGPVMVGPVIIAFGSAEQKGRFLPRIAANRDWWCQGYSEPGSGSDLASLQTQAVADGDDYVVNGSKTWTTMAQWADMMFCLVRTSKGEKRQEGISFLLLDMGAPGIEVRPIRTMDGGTEINQVFFDDVRVPKGNLVGEAGKGWTYAKFLLGHERLGGARVPHSKKQLERLKEIAAQEISGGRPLMEDPRFREKLATLEIDLLAVESTYLKLLADAGAGRAPGAESSFLKLKGSEIQQTITSLLFEAIGEYAFPYVEDSLVDGWNEDPIGAEYAAPLAPHYFNWRKASIYGGTNEVQRNIIAKMVLGF